MPLTSYQQEILDRFLTLPSCEVGKLQQCVDSLEEFEHENREVIDLLEDNNTTYDELVVLLDLPVGAAALLAVLAAFDITEPDELREALTPPLVASDLG